MQTNVQCQNDMGAVTWEASFGAVGYEARLAGRDGHSLSCYTKDTFCNVEGLHCGTIYYTNVIAIGETLNSSFSTTVLLVSGMAHSFTSFIILNIILNLLCHSLYLSTTVNMFYWHFK